MTKKAVEHNNILNELVRAVKTLQLYPDGHPTLDEILTKTHQKILRLTTESGEIKWTVDFKGIYFNKTSLLQNLPKIQQLTKEFLIRRIKEIVFTPQITIEELRHFFSLIIFDHEKLRAMGGAKVYMARKRVTGIRLNEMSPAALEKLIEEQAALEDAEHMAEEDEDETEEEGRADEGDEAQGGLSPDGGNGEQDREVLLDDLLRELTGERDLIKYQDLSVRIKELSTLLETDGQYRSITEILKIYTEHLDAESGLPEAIKRVAGNMMAELLTAKCVNHLLGGFVLKSDEDFKETSAILLHGGTVVHNTLLTLLLNLDDAKARHRIFKTAVGFGSKIRPEVENRLKDDRWYAVRQMLALLGEIGDRASLEKIIESYSHQDKRVKKEVLKSITRIPSEASLKLLLTALKETKDISLQGQAIISLGTLNDPLAVKPLGRIAVRNERFNERIKLKKEAIKALGFIKSPDAIPYLKKILFLKVWFNKDAYNEIRCIAAESLGKIGGEEATELIKKASERYGGQTLKVCMRLLERIDQ